MGLVFFWICTEHILGLLAPFEAHAALYVGARCVGTYIMHVPHLLILYAGPASYTSWLQGDLFEATFSLRSVVLLSRLKARFSDVNSLQGRTLSAGRLFDKGLEAFLLQLFRGESQKSSKCWWFQGPRLDFNARF